MNRRQLVQSAGATLAVSVAAPTMLFDPRAARAQNAPFKILTPDEAATIEALSDALVPGARNNGVSHYIDHELASPSPRLLLRFAQLPGVMAPYYHAGVAAFATAVGATGGGGGFSALSPDAQHTMIEALRTGTITPWETKGGATRPGVGDAVTAPMFYGMMRNDGVDVVYGSVKGFADLGIPYMAHIMPTATW